MDRLSVECSNKFRRPRFGLRHPLARTYSHWEYRARFGERVLNAANSEVGDRSWQGAGRPIAAGRDFIGGWVREGLLVHDAAQEHEVKCLAPRPVMFVLNARETVCRDRQASFL